MFRRVSRKEEVLSSYQEKVENLRSLGKAWNLSEGEIDEVLCHGFRALQNKYSTTKIARCSSSDIQNGSSVPKLEQTRKIIYSSVLFTSKILGFLLLSISIVYCVIVYHNPTQKFVTAYIQEYIYPYMRSVRVLTLPIINSYPSLTDWHEEQCLIKNPLYGVRGLACWPCEQVRSVLDLSGLSNFTDFYYHSGIPFIVKDALSVEIDFSTLQETYRNNKESIERGAPRIISTLPDFQLTSSLFAKDLESSLSLHTDLHVTWKVNRAAAARVIRQVFPRPYFVPSVTEVAIQRYVYLDGPKSQAYDMPLTDFANVWLAQGSGERLIVLTPSDECSKLCSRVSLVLQPKDVLFYNWQYWRPKSIPVEGSTGLSITFLGSFY